MGAVGRLGLAIVGYAMGGPLGFALGSLAGGILFPQKFPDIDQQGPRLNDVGVTNSAYGVGIPRVWGTHIVTGNMIWMGRPHQHAKTTSTTVGGKGGGGQTTNYTEYSYTASMAFLLCEGPMKRIVKIVANGQSIYDASGASVQMQVSGLHFRFYPGSETQLPDSIIAADKGYDNTSAYRGSCYIVFDELPLTPFGNRVPTFQFIVQESGDSVAHTESLEQESYPPNYGVDFKFGRKYQMYGSTRIEVVNLFTRETLLALPAPVSGVNGKPYQNVLAIAPSGDFIAATSGAIAPNTGFFTYPYDSIALIDGATLTKKLEIAPEVQTIIPITPSPHYYQFGPHSSVACAQYVGLGGDSRLIVAAGGNWLSTTRYSVGVFDMGSEDPMVVDFAGLPFMEGQFYYFAAGDEISGGVEFWGVQGTSADELSFFKVTVKDKLSAGVFEDPKFEPQAEFDFVRAFNRADVDPQGRITSFHDPSMFGLSTNQGNFALDGLLYDASDESILLSFLNHAFILKISRAGEILWRFEGRPNYVFPQGFGQTLQPGSRIEGGTYAFRGTNSSGANGWHIIDTRSGQEVEWVPGSASGSDVYDSPYDSFNRMAVTRNEAVYFGRAPAGMVSVADVVESISEECGQDANDFTNIAALQVGGYLRAKPMTGRAAISPLASLYNFDAIDAGGFLRWIVRGQPSIMDYEPDGMVVVDEDTGSVVTNIRQQEPELPQSVSVTYYDPGRAYESSTYARQRYTGNEGYETMRSRNQVAIDAPVATDPDTIKRLADVILMGAWNGRDKQTLRLPRPAILLDPGDVVTLNIPGVFPQDVRIDSHSVGADLAVEVKSTSQDSSQYSSLVTAEEGSGFPDLNIAIEMLTRLYLLPIPYIQDENDRLRQTLVVYFAMGAFFDGWRDGLLERLPASGAWAPVGTIAHDSPHGSILGVLPKADPDTVFCTDEDLQIRVRLVHGTLESVTQEQMTDGANIAVVVRSGSEAEIIQFRDATLEEDGSYTLSGILRGRRGTDSWALESDTAAGSAFVVIGQGMTGAVPVALADLGVVQTYRGSGANQDPDDGDVRSIRVGGYDLMPYAPVHVSVEPSGDDLLISWVRRTRLRGELRGSTGDVPLEEDTEAYEIDVSVNDVVVRTITATTTSVTYTEAQQIEDGISPNVQTTIRVYQMSAQVGRGFPSYPVSFGKTLEVAQASVFAVVTPGKPEFEIVQHSILSVALTQPTVHVAQSSVFLVTDIPVNKAGDGEVAQHANFIIHEPPRPEFEVAQHANFIIHEPPRPEFEVAQHSIFFIQEETGL